MTDVDILDGVLQREGGVREAAKRPDGSWDLLTFRGITTNTLGIWRKLGRPATRAELLAMPETETLQIYRTLYIEGPGFVPERVPFEPLRLQLIDFGVNSSPPRAIRWLQRLLRLPVTGVLDSRATDWMHEHAGYLWLVNEGLAGVRARMIAGAVDDGTIRREDERGLLRRAAAFVETRA